jgi:hypothetical protein
VDVLDKAELKGEIMLINRENLFVLKSEGKYAVCHMDFNNCPREYKRGDTVEVTGEIIKDSPLKNELKVNEIFFVKGPATPPPPIGVLSLKEVMQKRLTGDVVVTWGEVDEVKYKRVRLRDSSFIAEVDTSPFDPRDMFPMGRKVLIIGELIVKPTGNEIELILSRPIDFLQRPGVPTEAESIADILEKKPVGKMVRAKGRLSVFIGSVDATVLHDEDQLLIVHQSDKCLSADVKAGSKVEVIGVFELEKVKGREYGSLKEARIVPPDLLAAKEKIKKSM